MTDTLPEQASIGPEPTPDDPYKEIKATLAEFLLSLIQAFLRTGYYTPDHPESKSAKVGLYDDFKNLFTQKGELTIMVRDDPEGRSILVEGILPETQYLNSLMFRGMAEMYTPKFAKFLERKDLISLTLKDTMTRTEFTNFVDVMSEPSFFDTQKKSDKERFSQTLQERGIFNISYIFSEELLAAKRKIPWRAQIALSRLNKDFRMIPLYFDLDTEGLKNVRRQTIQDVARPIQTSEIIYPILMNSDLAQTEEFVESEINEEIIACLSDKLLLELSQTLLKDTLHNKKARASLGKSPELAGKIAAALNRQEIRGREGILEQYFKHKLISFEQLSEASQRRTKLEQLTHKFLEHSNSFFEKFDRIQDREKYLKAARTCTKIIPELILRDRYEEILEIISHIDRHCNEKKQRSIYAGQILEEMAKGEIPRALKAKFVTGRKEIRQVIAPIFLKLHAGSVPHLLSLFMESDDQLVRKDVWDILIRIDSSATTFILNELNDKELKTESALDLIRILGEIKCDQFIEPLTKTLITYLKHENPHLREEALWAYYKIRDGKGEKVYLNLLNDKDVRVQKKAIQCLGKIKSKAGLEKFVHMLKSVEDYPSDVNHQIEAHLFSAFGFYGNTESPGMGSPEDFLLETLDRRLGLGPLKFLKKKESPLSEKAVAAICETLGTIATQKSYPILKKLEKQYGKLWQNKAQEALSRIAEREEGPSSIETS